MHTYMHTYMHTLFLENNPRVCRAHALFKKCSAIGFQDKFDASKI